MSGSCVNTVFTPAVSHPHPGLCLLLHVIKKQFFLHCPCLFSLLSLNAIHQYLVQLLLTYMHCIFHLLHYIDRHILFKDVIHKNLPHFHILFTMGLSFDILNLCLDACVIVLVQFSFTVTALIHPPLSLCSLLYYCFKRNTVDCLYIQGLNEALRQTNLDIYYLTFSRNHFSLCPT